MPFTPSGIYYPAPTDPFPPGFAGTPPTYEDGWLRRMAESVDESMPRGLLAVAVVTSSQGPFTSVADITGLAIVSFVAPPNRRFRYEGRVNVQSVSGTVSAQLTITTAGNTAVDADAISTSVTGTASTPKMRVTHLLDTGAGSTLTFKLRLSGGGSGVNTTSSTSRPGVIALYDDGPSL